MSNSTLKNPRSRQLRFVRIPRWLARKMPSAEFGGIPTADWLTGRTRGLAPPLDNETKDALRFVVKTTAADAGEKFRNDASYVVMPTPRAALDRYLSGNFKKTHILGQATMLIQLLTCFLILLL